MTITGNDHDVHFDDHNEITNGTDVDCKKRITSGIERKLELTVFLEPVLCPLWSAVLARPKGLHGCH